jgi:hypothetical protein
VNSCGNSPAEEQVKPKPTPGSLSLLNQTELLSQKKEKEKD